MEIKKLFAGAGAALSLVTLLGMGVQYAFHLVKEDKQAAVTAAVEAERNEAYGQFGAEVHMLAQLIVAEIGGQPEEWQYVAATVINRLEGSNFPTTFEEVMKQLRSDGTGCQFNGLCDEQMEKMTTSQGLAAIAFAQATLRAYYNGSYVSPLPEAHSFCVPAACDAAKGYFGQFQLLAEHEGHRYYGGEALSPMAVSTSLRPMPRPEYLVEEAIAREVASSMD